MTSMEHSAVGFDDPTLIDPLSAILNDLTQELDGDPTTFQELLQQSQTDLGSNNIANITNAADYFRCVENNKCYDQVDMVDYLINVTDFIDLHTAMGTNRVSDQLIEYKNRLLLHKEELRTKGVNTDKNFVGRISDMEKIVNILGDEYHPCRGVCICGLGGMGKTSLANEICYRLLKSNPSWKTIRIDLRERDSLKDLLCLTLGELHETFSSTDIVDMGAKLWKAIVNIKRRTILLFDNIDGLLQTNNKRELPRILQFFDDFLQKLDSIKSECQVKILITSRQKLIPDERIIQEMRRISKAQTRLNDLVLEIELKPLQAKEAEQLYKRCVDEKYKIKSGGSVAKDIVEFCGYCPLAIRSACSAINSGLLQPQVIKYNLKIAAEKGGLTHVLQVSNCLQQTFMSLDKNFQKKLIRLTLFQTAKFDAEAASSVLGEAQIDKSRVNILTMQTKMDLLALKSRHFVEIIDPEEYQSSEKDVEVFGTRILKYSLHPLVYMFLIELAKNGKYEKELQKAKAGFVQHFEHLLLKIGAQMDKDCMKAWKMIEENKKHLINMFKSEAVDDIDTNPLVSDMKERILLCTQMVLIGNLLLGDFHRFKPIRIKTQRSIWDLNPTEPIYRLLWRKFTTYHSHELVMRPVLHFDMKIHHIDKMINISTRKRSRLEVMFWKIEKANWFFDLDRNELVEEVLKEIQNTCNDVVGKGTAMAPVFGCFFFLKGKLSLRRNQPAEALEDLLMAQKLFNEHKYIRHSYLYHISHVFEKIANSYLKLEPPNIDKAFKYLCAAFTKASEKAENFNNLDIPSLTASIGRCYYIQGIREKQIGNLSCAKESFEKSIGYYTKAMALDTQMNLHKYDNYADKLVKRSESHVELGLLKVSGALSDAVKDIREADDLRRKILQPPSYKCTHTPHLLGKFLCIKAKQEYEKKHKVNAINHLWEGIMYYEVTDKMIQCGGLHPIHLHQQEYEEIKTEHLWALQHTRDTEKIPEAIKFYNDFQTGKFESDRKKDMSEKKTIQNSEFIPIEDLKAEIMMGGNNMTFTPTVQDSDSEEEVDHEAVDTVFFEDFKLEPDELMDFDKLFIRMEHPDSADNYSLSDEEGPVGEADDKVKDLKVSESFMDIQHDIDQISKTGVADLMGENNDDVFDEGESALKEVTASNLLTNVRRKSTGTESLSSTSSQSDLSIIEKRKRFQHKRSRDASMQKFLDDLNELTVQAGRGVLSSTKSSSKDTSFEMEMPVIDYLHIVDTEDKEQKKQILRKMHQKYASVQEEEFRGNNEGVAGEVEGASPQNKARRKRQMRESASDLPEDTLCLKSSRDNN